MMDVFISYSREDSEFTGQLEAALKDKGKEVWRDVGSVPPSVPFPPEIEKGIVESNGLIFILSPDSVMSGWCLRELEIAIENGKRIVPLHYKEFDEAFSPKGLGELNWIDFRNPSDFENSLGYVLYALETDFEYVGYHTWLQVRAREWESKEKSASATLHGEEIEIAERWLALSGGKEPQSTELQGEFILASRRVASRRQRRILTGVGIALAISIVLGVLAYSQFLAAQEREKARATQQAIAEEQRQIAVAGRLAAQARNHIENNPPLALMLALESQGIVQTDEATQVIAELPYYYPSQAEVLTRHNAPVTSVTWSPEGSYFASGSEDQSIIVWSASRDQPVAVLKGPDETVTGLAWNPDSSKLASTYEWADEENPIIIWDIKIGEPTMVLTDSIGMFGTNNIAWSKDGSRLAAVTGISSVVWDQLKGEIISRFQGHLVGIASASDIIDVDISPDGSQLASSGDDRIVLIWDLATNQPIMSLEGEHKSSITTIAWSPDGSHLASGSGQHGAFPGDNTVVVWDLKNGRGFTNIEGEYEVTLGEAIATLRGHSGGVNSVVWSPDARTIASGSDDGTIIIWDAFSGRRLATLIGHTDKVNSVDFSPDGTKLISGSDDHTVIVWSVTQDQLTKSLEGHSGEITSLVWSPDGKQLASGSTDASIIVWDADSEQLIQTLTGHRLPIRGLAWSPDGSHIVSGTEDRAPYGSNVVWELASGEIVGLSFTDANGCGAVAWNPDGKSWVESTHAGVALWFTRWNFDNQQYAIPPQERFRCVNAMEFSPDGSQLALGTSDGNIFLWSMTTNSSVITLTGRIEGISSVSWNPKGSRIAAAGTNWVVVWDVKSTQPVLSLKGNSSVSWSPDGKRLISSGEGNNVVVWDSTSGQTITRLAGHTGNVTRLVMSPDGKQLATGGTDRNIRLVSARFLERPCQWALRNMSLDEWERYFPGESYRRTCPELSAGN